MAGEGSDSPIQESPGPSFMLIRTSSRWKCSFALATLLASLLTTTPVRAQARAPVWDIPWALEARDMPAFVRPAASDTVATGAMALPCPDCNPPKRFWAATSELMAVEFIPWALTRYVRNGEWSRISPETWATNLKFPWQWDNNHFTNNQFAHPYHGSQFYNAGRSNGYNFWQSAPFAIGGSLIWELFGEVWAPAPNDLLNTGLGGITLGEMLWRMSSLTLNNRATGSNRVVREIGATLINPVRGFNRLIRGEMSQISETPADWRPTTIATIVDLGYRRFSNSNSLGDANSLNQAQLQFWLLYGNQLEDLGKSPFSAFQMTGSLVTNNAGRGILSSLLVRGSLAARPLGPDASRRQLALFMTYDYISNPVIDFGSQGFQGGIVGRTDPKKSAFLYGEAMLRAMPIAAIRSDYFVTAEGRDYDYGIGLGARVEGRLLYRSAGYLRLSGGYTLLPVISGFPGNHHLWLAGLEARGYLSREFGVGASYSLFWRRSNYTFNPNVSQDATELRFFLSTTLPRRDQ
jgi:hypothetical protein